MVNCRQLSFRMNIFVFLSFQATLQKAPAMEACLKQKLSADRVWYPMKGTLRGHKIPVKLIWCLSQSQRIMANMKVSVYLLFTVEFVLHRNIEKEWRMDVSAPFSSQWKSMGKGKTKAFCFLVFARFKPFYPLAFYHSNSGKLPECIQQSMS